MLPFGHLGIGSQLAAPWARGLSKKALLIGTLIPDLIDKPLFYGFKFFGPKLPNFLVPPGTRTLGHTALFLVLWMTLALIKKSKRLKALTLGAASHLFLDATLDLAIPPYTLCPVIYWPWAGWHFPVAPFQTVTEHFHRSLHPLLLGCEIIGVLLLMLPVISNRSSKDPKRANQKMNPIL